MWRLGCRNALSACSPQGPDELGRQLLARRSAQTNQRLRNEKRQPEGWRRSAFSTGLTAWWYS